MKTASGGYYNYNYNYDKSLALYLEEISKTPLLTAEEEVDLAKKIHKGDEEALNRLISANLRFVVSIAKDYRNSGLPLRDLINEGNIGLMKAADRFDETKGYKFISYAVWWVRQSILQALTEQSRIVRLPLNKAGVLHQIKMASHKITQKKGREATLEELAEELNISIKELKSSMYITKGHLSLDAPFRNDSEGGCLLDILENTHQVAPDELHKTKAMKWEIRKALKTLKPQEAEITALYFGIDSDKPYTLDELSERFNLSRERIRQIKNKALKRLRHLSRSRQLLPYWEEL